MTPRSRISIVIPTRNGGRTLERLLDAIAVQEGGIVPEIIAIDSGSTDGTVDLLRTRGATVLQVDPRCFNHGVSRNEALSRASTEFAVLIVQDAVPASRHWLRALVQPLLEDEMVAGSFARQQPWPDASRLTVHHLAQWRGTQLEPRVTGPLTADVFAAMPPSDRHLACVFDNVCSCVRLSVWRNRPFRNTRIAEDLEWALEVMFGGFRIAYTPAAVVWHSHERSAAYELRRTYLVHQRLQSLFGLSTVPSIGALIRAVGSNVPLHMRAAARERCGRPRALARAAALAVAWPLGQYLGAKAAREGRELMQAMDV
ncbi:MAG: glycosyltransferase family 2 protein [Acidobacteria bacterium]|nr:glycosyltransferase family 2 protein [Acidobacteriota bacterium]MCA1651518.1 glycosyltransferase family 2 protein [Acidobacteriota bacterium]